MAVPREGLPFTQWITTISMLLTYHKIQEVVSNVQLTRKEKNTKSDKSYTRGVFSDKVTLAIDFTDNPMVQCECDVPVVKNTFTSDRK